MRGLFAAVERRGVPREHDQSSPRKTRVLSKKRANVSLVPKSGISTSAPSPIDELHQRAELLAHVLQHRCRRMSSPLVGLVISNRREWMRTETI
jgi:hypothetical protein